MTQNFQKSLNLVALVIGTTFPVLQLNSRWSCFWKLSKVIVDVVSKFLITDKLLQSEKFETIQTIVIQDFYVLRPTLETFYDRNLRVSMRTLSSTTIESSITIVNDYKIGRKLSESTFEWYNLWGKQRTVFGSIISFRFNSFHQNLQSYLFTSNLMRIPSKETLFHVITLSHLVKIEP